MAVSKMTFTSILAVMADLAAVVPVCATVVAYCFNTLDLGVFMTLSTTMFNWCGTALRVLCIRFKYWKFQI
jgi:hypothetical protein